jgi:hypothetical protein
MTFDPKIRLTESRLEDSNPLGLRFDSHDDAELVERGKDFLAFNKFNFVKRYKEGEIAIKLECMIDGDFSKYELVFVAIPSGRIEGTDAHREPADLNDDIGKRHRTKDAVLLSINKSVQCPKEVVRSFVWLRVAQDDGDVFRDSLANVPHGFIKGSFRVTDGKVTMTARDGKQSLIKSVSEVDCGVSSMPSQRPWHRFTKSELEHLPDAVIAYLSDVGASIFIVKERLDLPLKFENVILSPCDAEL